MKKAVLCAVALAFGTFAYAQVAGAPTASTPVPVLSTAAGANAGQSVQNGDDNKVRVRQAGELNTVYTEQDNGSDVGGNLARVRQTGNVNGNQADSGEANAAEVRQSGGANQSTTRQEGDYNNSTTLQGQNDDGSTGNKARIQQGIANQAEANYAAIEQDGDDNQASTLQIVDNNDAWTRQIGDENKSMIVQNGAPEASDGHEAMVIQEGDRNESSIDQSGSGARNIAVADQYGDDNAAKQLQTTHAGVGMTGNRASVKQGVRTPQDYSLVPLVDDLFDDANDLDDDSVPVFGSTLAGNGNIAFQTQAGKENEADMYQFGGTAAGGSNYGEQHQAWGWGNDAALIQGHFSPGEPDNYAKQYQAGDNNDAGLLQSGSGHKGLQDQRGHRNDALSTQLGENNLLNIHQRGNDNAATSIQHGDANAALIVQRHGQSFVAEQNADLGAFDLSGGGNQIDALQLGPNGNFGTDGIECGFDDPKDPWMDYTVPGFELDDVCPDC